jgi:hypothetical protein
MRKAFCHLKELPKNFRFIADGYSAYPLAAQQFFREFGDAFQFSITMMNLTYIFKSYKFIAFKYSDNYVLMLINLAP